MALPTAVGSTFAVLRRQSTNLQAATLWGVAAGSAAIYLVQPFDYIRKTFFEKPEEK